MRIERGYESCVTMKLVAITFLFSIEKCLDVGTFVASGLEIDDPAYALGDERAVDNDMRDRAVVDAGKRPFARSLRMARRKQPAPALVGEHIDERAVDVLRGKIELCLIDALVRELGANARQGSSEARIVPRGETVAPELREESMRDDAHTARCLARPVERQDIA